AGIERVLADLVARQVEMHVDDFDHVPAECGQVLLCERFHRSGMSGRRRQFLVTRRRSLRHRLLSPCATRECGTGRVVVSSRTTPAPGFPMLNGGSGGWPRLGGPDAGDKNILGELILTLARRASHVRSTRRGVCVV